jgi:hypothetical protein
MDGRMGDQTKGCQIFLGAKIGENVPKRPQTCQIPIKYTKIAIIDMKQTKNFHPKAFKNIPKFTFLV